MEVLLFVGHVDCVIRSSTIFPTSSSKTRRRSRSSRKRAQTCEGDLAFVPSRHAGRTPSGGTRSPRKQSNPHGVRGSQHGGGGTSSGAVRGPRSRRHHLASTARSPGGPRDSDFHQLRSARNQHHRGRRRTRGQRQARRLVPAHRDSLRSAAIRAAHAHRRAVPTAQLSAPGLPSRARVATACSRPPLDLFDQNLALACCSVMGRLGDQARHAPGRNKLAFPA
jgi:hypothetical protein